MYTLSHCTSEGLPAVSPSVPPTDACSCFLSPRPPRQALGTPVNKRTLTAAPLELSVPWRGQPRRRPPCGVRSVWVWWVR